MSDTDDGYLDQLNALPADAPWLKVCVIALDYFLRALAPVSFGLWALKLAQIIFAGSEKGSFLGCVHLPRWILLYAALECAFFAFYLRRKRRILKDEHPLIAPTDTERERLFARVIESFETADEARSFIRGWFHTREKGRWTGQARHVEIDELRHDNVSELLANAFFNQTLQDVRAHPQHSAVLERFEQTVEEKIQHVFPSGYNEEIDCIRQMLEDVPVEHRPFIFYAATFAASTLVSTVLKLAGFRKEVLIAPLVDPSRAGRRRREAQAFEYFVHPGPDPTQTRTAEAKLPIVICAGLAGIVGIFHVACYLMWKTKRPIFVVGLPAVSLRLQEIGTRPRTASDVWYDNDGFGKETLWEPVGDRHKQVRASIPSLDLQTRGLRLMIDRYGYTGAVFVSHSLGTSLMSFAARQDPPMVKFSILIDPITFMIWHSRLVKIFLYKKPDAVGEHFIRLFSREAGIVSVVSRAFFWHQVASFVRPKDSKLPYKGDTVEPRKTFVILSSEDALIPARQIAERLKKGGIPFWMLEGEHHASWLMSSATFLKVMRLVIDEADKADTRTSPIMISRPSFLRADSSATAPLVQRRSSSFFGAPSYEPPGMTRRLSSQGTGMLSVTTAGMRRRASSVLGNGLMMTSPTTEKEE